MREGQIRLIRIGAGVFIFFGIFSVAGSVVAYKFWDGMRHYRTLRVDGSNCHRETE